MNATTVTIDAPAEVRSPTRRPRIVHVPSDDPGKSLCGRRNSRKTAAAGAADKCVVCLEMAQHGRFGAR